MRFSLFLHLSILRITRYLWHEGFNSIVSFCPWPRVQKSIRCPRLTQIWAWIYPFTSKLKILFLAAYFYTLVSVLVLRIWKFVLGETITRNCWSILFFSSPTCADESVVDCVRRSQKLIARVKSPLKEHDCKSLVNCWKMSLSTFSVSWMMFESQPGLANWVN